MRIVFAGSPEFAVPALEKLVYENFNVIAVVTQPDKPMGRKQLLTPTPVKKFALLKGLPVYDFQKIRLHADELSALGADIMITCAYGQILTREILDCFPMGVWNIHASLLPKFRGASPIQSCILAGEEFTGITVMKTELSLDTGDILLVKRCATDNLTCGELSARLSRLGAEAAAEAVRYLSDGKVQLLMQDDSQATYCKKINKTDCRLDFNLTAEELCRKIKAFSPEPAAFCNFNGLTLNIYNADIIANVKGEAGRVLYADKRGIAVGCGGETALKITDVQLSGGKRMPAADFVNGRKIKEGDTLD